MRDSHADRRRRPRRPSAYSPYTLRSYEGDFRLFVE